MNHFPWRLFLGDLSIALVITGVVLVGAELVKAGFATNHLNLFLWWWVVMLVSAETYIWSIHSSKV